VRRALHVTGDTPNKVGHDTMLARGPRGSEPAWVLDPTPRVHQWRRLFAEMFGTFFLVVSRRGGRRWADSQRRLSRTGPLVAQVVAPGVMVMAVIYFMGMVSGAHLTPAVTVGFAARGDFSWSRVAGYVVAQLIGAISAVLLLRALFGTVGHLGATLQVTGSPRPRRSSLKRS
jgi:aquaporin Z